MTSMSETRLVREQGVTAPAGFRATGIAAGIKKSGAPDLALVFNEGPDHHAAGVFTSNKVKAAPVLWTQQMITTGRARAELDATVKGLKQRRAILGRQLDMAGEIAESAWSSFTTNLDKELGDFKAAVDRASR